MSVPSAGPGPLAHCRLEVFKAFPRAELDVPVVFLGTLWDPARIWRVLISQPSHTLPCSWIKTLKKQRMRIQWMIQDTWVWSFLSFRIKNKWYDLNTFRFGVFFSKIWRESKGGLFLHCATTGISEENPQEQSLQTKKPQCALWSSKPVSFEFFFHLFPPKKKIGQEFPCKNDGSMKLVIFMMHLESDDLQAFYGAKVVSYWHHVFWIWFYWTFSLCPSFLEMISSNPSTSSNGQSQRIRAKQLMSGRHPVLAQAS